MLSPGQVTVRKREASELLSAGHGHSSGICSLKSPGAGQSWGEFHMAVNSHSLARHIPTPQQECRRRLGAPAPGFGSRANLGTLWHHIPPQSHPHAALSCLQGTGLGWCCLSPAPAARLMPPCSMVPSLPETPACRELIWEVPAPCSTRDVSSALALQAARAYLKQPRGAHFSLRAGKQHLESENHRRDL